MFSLLATLVAMGGARGWCIARSITGPIHTAVGVAEMEAAGDLRACIDGRATDETGRLLTALAAMNQSLVSIVGTGRSSSDSIATAPRRSPAATPT